MFDLGFQELIVIFLVALLVFGPKKLPEFSRTLGKWVIEIKRNFYNVKVQIENEFDEIEKKSVDDIDKADSLPPAKDESVRKATNENEKEKV